MCLSSNTLVYLACVRSTDWHVRHAPFVLVNEFMFATDKNANCVTANNRLEAIFALHYIHIVQLQNSTNFQTSKFTCLPALLFHALQTHAVFFRVLSLNFGLHLYTVLTWNPHAHLKSATLDAFHRINEYFCTICSLRASNTLILQTSNLNM